MTKLLVVRLRGEAGTRRDVIDTFKMLGMKKIHSFVILENTLQNIGMIKKINNFVSWGESSPEVEKLLEGIGKKSNVYTVGGLKSPKGGLKSKKFRPPRGDLGYCGAGINDLVKKMI